MPVCPGLPEIWSTVDVHDMLVLHRATSGKIDLKKGVLADYAIRGVRPFKSIRTRFSAPGEQMISGTRCRGFSKMAYGPCQPLREKRHRGRTDSGGASCEGGMDIDRYTSPYTMEFLVRNDGSLQVSGDGHDREEIAGTTSVPGMRMELAGRENLCYYGRGPQGNYIDRWSSAFVGRYEDKVENQYCFLHARPGKRRGNKDGRASLLLLSDGEGTEVEITGVSQPIAFSALHYAPEDLDPGLTRKMQHSIDVVPQKDVFLHVDLKQRGLGGDNSWGMFPYNPYRLWDKKYSYSYLIRLK